MKKILFYTAALVMALSVASCGNKKETKDVTVKETAKKETVKKAAGKKKGLRIFHGVEGSEGIL